MPAGENLKICPCRLDVFWVIMQMPDPPSHYYAFFTPFPLRNYLMDAPPGKSNRIIAWTLLHWKLPKDIFCVYIIGIGKDTRRPTNPLPTQHFFRNEKWALLGIAAAASIRAGNKYWVSFLIWCFFKNVGFSCFSTIFAPIPFFRIFCH